MLTSHLTRSHRTPASGLAVILPFGGAHISLGLSWLLFLPLGIWAIATQYVTVLGAFFDQAQTWLVALLIGALLVLSLVLHSLAHAWTARLVGAEMPDRIPLYAFGDAAQVWPAAASPWQEALIAGAGPVANLLLAGIGYLLWNAQLHPYLNVSMPFLGLLNACLAILNLTPGYPLDGGRLTRALAWGLLGRPAEGPGLARNLGYLVSASLAGWGIILIAQRLRFGLQTGGANLLAAALFLLVLAVAPAWQWNRPLPTPGQGVRPLSAASRTRRMLLVAILIVVLLIVASSIVPTDRGLEAPGVALAVESMVQVPPEHAHPSAGSFILTTVIQQTPITIGEWAYARLDPAMKIVPPAQIVPPNTTPQQQAQQGFQMLDESKTTAVVVGLRLAGYDVPAAGKGAAVDSVLAESLSQGLLKPGDIIIGVNGQPVATTADLIRLVGLQNTGDTVHLQTLRSGARRELDVRLLPPAAPGGSPRLGITVESAGLDYKLPFPVKIVPQKIVGGPSAGLMFALAVYDALTPGDLTGGRRIAGTGTIGLDGAVGPIGGVEQKVAAAENAGATYFLSPAENYAAAHAVARRIQVIEVTSAEQAIRFLAGLPAAIK
jgi:PDZ domain-containing protein